MEDANIYLINGQVMTADQTVSIRGQFTIQLPPWFHRTQIPTLSKMLFRFELFLCFIFQNCWNVSRSVSQNKVSQVFFSLCGCGTLTQLPEWDLPPGTLNGKLQLFQRFFSLFRVADRGEGILHSFSLSAANALFLYVLGAPRVDEGGPAWEEERKRKNIPVWMIQWRPRAGHTGVLKPQVYG